MANEKIAPNAVEEKRIDLVEHYKSMFGTSAGLTVLYDLIRTCGVFDSSFNSDPILMAYHEGRRSVALSILSKLDTDVSELRRLIRESYDADI